MAESIKLRAILEIMGAPEIHVKKTMDMVITKLKESKSFKLFKEKTSEIARIEDRPFWSIFTEVELEFYNQDGIMGFCLDFMPSSIEILKPLEFNFDKNTLDDLWNDLISRLHHYDMLVKNLHAENTILKRKMQEFDPKPFKQKPTDVEVKKDKK